MNGVLKRTETVSSALIKAAARLKCAGVENPRQEAELLLSAATGMKKTDIWREPEAVIRRDMEKFDDFIERRATGVPYAYIIGKKEFMGKDFIVTPDVLVPRPETELLVKKASEYNENSGIENPEALDMGCGSGVIGICLSLKHPGIRVTACDISQESLEVARHNAGIHGVGERMEFVRSDIFSSFKDRPFDMIVCNPPYIGEIERGSLQRELAFEPDSALFSGIEGMDFISRFIGQSLQHLREKGILFMEVGDGQMEKVKGKVLKAGFGRYEIFEDFAGIERVIAACMK
ncbi:MAG: peptide chain release factor N(5)-glutamine methyltransferase [Chloroflexi bacterium]|nr:peptide chain release factor N(5)-glutamine methyltransferase [Chloroflexota bacterium]